MTILQQEEAKNFFKDAKPDILYGYFERGTMLNNYWEILGKKTIADIGIFKSNLAKQLKVLEEKREYLKKLQFRISRIQIHFVQHACSFIFL